MEPAKVLTSAILGTSAMTLFSYLVSEKKNENYKEPDVLAMLLKKLKYDTSKEIEKITGWTSHYAVGILFDLIFDQIWKKTGKPSLKSGLLLGAASGLIGIAAWKLMFKSHPNPPAKNLRKYFSHLLLAHLVFGAFSVAGYNLMDKNKLDRAFNLN